nr:putative zinc finger, CCHC-type [Tanacetum cinerariifolium]
MDGVVQTYKARLVAKGHTQTPGIDYDETFSPVADIRAIRILIAIAAFYDYEIWQMDVKTAFLNEYLFEEVYMEQHEGFVKPKFPNRTGYVFVLNGGVVDWKSTKQSIFATSSAEVEYVAVYDASKEAVWVRKLISGLVEPNSVKTLDPLTEFRYMFKWDDLVLDSGRVGIQGLFGIHVK